MEIFTNIIEWPDGELNIFYKSDLKDATSHLSGWAMMNNNNHCRKILKKSCRGVILCLNSCTLADKHMTIRPATTNDKLAEQLLKRCPVCRMRTLYHEKCSGNESYPVTHFWELMDFGINFRSKGTHDHPRPPNLKPPTSALDKLVKFCAYNPNVSPKEISAKIGEGIHEAFKNPAIVSRKIKENENQIDLLKRSFRQNSRRIDAPEFNLNHPLNHDQQFIHPNQVGQVGSLPSVYQSDQHNVYAPMQYGNTQESQETNFMPPRFFNSMIPPSQQSYGNSARPQLSDWNVNVSYDIIHYDPRTMLPENQYYNQNHHNYSFRNFNNNQVMGRAKRQMMNWGNFNPYSSNLFNYNPEGGNQQTPNNNPSVRKKFITQDNN